MPSTETNPELLEHRVRASAESNGTSTNSIVDCAIRVAEIHNAKAILDFGAGRGDLIRKILDLKPDAQITGADLFPRPECLPASVQWIQGDLNLPLEKEPGQFDLILSTEVIEHLENPRAVARELFRLLRPGGRLVLTTPNQESVRALLSLVMNGHFVFFQDSCYPAHITALLRKDLTRVFTEAGFKDIDFQYVPHGGIPKLPQISWQRVSFGLLRGRSFSDNIVMCATR